MLEKFTPFVLRDKIEKTILPSNTILNLFELYDKNYMNDYLSHMLLHMNIKSLDNIQIKDKMEELNLITPLLYCIINKLSLNRRRLERDRLWYRIK